MHSYQWDGVQFEYNTDSTGEIYITRAGLGSRAHGRIQIPMDTLQRFVWECYEKPRRIAEIEAASYRGPITYRDGWFDVPVENPEATEETDAVAQDFSTLLALIRDMEMFLPWHKGMCSSNRSVSRNRCDCDVPSIKYRARAVLEEN